MKPDFSKEDLQATPVEVLPGVWLCGEAHSPGGCKNFRWNNRSFIFRLTLLNDLGGVKKGKEALFVNGLGKRPTVEAVKGLQEKIGLKVVALLVNGGDHHISIKFWYDAFPDMKVWICPTRVPATVNGKALMEQYPDRWELADNTTIPHHVYQLTECFGDQVDCVLFNQLFCYADSTGKTCDSWCHPEDEPKVYSNVEAFTKLAGTLFQDFSSQNDEPCFYHKASKLLIYGHHVEFIYCPKDYEMPSEMEPIGWAFKFLTSAFINRGRWMTTLASGVDSRLGDPDVHAQQWQEVLKFDFEYACGHHDPIGVCGPIDNKDIVDGEGGLKGHLKRVLEQSGELTGKRDPGSYWPWRPANAVYKVTQNEAGFRKKYGDPPALRYGGPGYDKSGVKIG